MHAPPDLTTEGPDDLVALDGGIVVPPPIGGPPRRQHASGVLDAAGAPVANAVTWSNGAPVNSAPPMPGPQEIAPLPGSWLFGGILFGHFGHFLVESTTRLWALDGVRAADPALRGIVFTPKAQHNTERVVEVQRPLLQALGAGGLEIVNATGPLRVERLHIPRQGFGMFDMIEGSRAFRDHIRRHAGQGIAPAGHERIYISRSRLPPQRGGLLGEALIEAWLAREGYEPFHPQLHSARAQIAQYKAARRIVTVDCTPLHLVGFVGDAGQKVAIINRRSMDLGQYFVRQLRRFRDIDAVEIGALVADWVPQPGTRPGRSSWGEVDLPGLGAELARHGMIADPGPWRPLTEAERAGDLARLEHSHKTVFTRLAAPSRAAAPRPAPG